MDQVLVISHNIIIVWGAVIILGLVIVVFILINILLKLNSIISDMKEKYDYTMAMLFRPFELVKSLLNKFTKNG